MTTPYTYLLKHEPTNTYYYGCRFADGCSPSDFWTKYKTSSKYVKQLIEKYGVDSFKFEIRKTFNSKDKARFWETKVLKRMKVVSREDFINKTDNISVSTENSLLGVVGRIPSEKQRLAVSKVGLSNIGRKHTAETKVKVSNALYGNTYKLGKIESTETRLKKSLSKIGKPSNAVGNYQPVCSCIICKKQVTSSSIKQHSNKHI